MGRPELYPIKKLIGFDDEAIAAVETWRLKQKPPWNFSEAIRRLVEIGLRGPSEPTKKKKGLTGMMEKR